MARAHGPGLARLAGVRRRTAEIFRTDFLYRGVPIPAGDHVLEFIYRPRSFAVGALGSALGVLCIVALAWSPRASRRHCGGTG
jgi:uncharacterized membrane protein YfhO